MRKIVSITLSFLFIFSAVTAQNSDKKQIKGHTDHNKFRQLKDVLPTPNNRRTASGGIT